MAEPRTPADDDRQPTPVAPPPIETAPSATGLVDGDGSELRPTSQSPDPGEEN